MDIFRFLIGNSWKEYDIYYMPQMSYLSILNSNSATYNIAHNRSSKFELHIYICVYIHIYFVWRRRREWTIRIIEHCCEVSRQHLKMASKYKYSIFSSFFWSTSTIFSRLFFISMSPTSYNASWWCRNDVLFYLILACMWCIKLIMQEK